MENAPVRIPSLDGLRTISIVLVIVGHFFHVLGFGYFGNFGNLGVRVFFVISGFLITGLLLKEIEKTSTIHLLKFYYRRTLRIFPPFYFYVLVILTATILGFADVSAKSFWLASFYLTDYVSPQTWYFGHSWSLAVEEQFYLIFPGLLFLLGLRRAKFLLIFLVIICPFLRIADYRLFSDAIWGLKGFHSNMDALAIGCLLALFYAQLHQIGFYKKLLDSNLVILLSVAILFFNFQSDHPHFFYGVSISAMNILIAFCIDWSVTNYNSAVGKILNSNLFVTLGMMSYSIYLWQQPFFNPDNQSILTQTPFNFISLTIMTLISYFLIEKNSLRFRQKLEGKLFGERKNPPAEPVYQN